MDGTLEDRCEVAESGIAEPVAAPLRVPIRLQARDVDALDPLAVFAAAGSAPRFYWEQPAQGAFRVAIGALEKVCVQGPDRFARAAELARSLFARVDGTGLAAGDAALIGGFAFADTDLTGPWHGWAAGELRLPAVAFIGRDGHCRRIAAAGHAYAAPVSRPIAPLRGGVEIEGDDAPAYRARVRAALAEIDAGRAEKLVLARSLRIRARRPLDAVAWLAALRERFPGCTLYAIGEGDAVFLGASPERLVSVRGEEVETIALAGSAPRGASREADRALAAALLASAKDAAEHAIVVRRLIEVLSDCCGEVQAPATPQIVATRTVQHLATPIRARRSRQDPSLLELVGRLHPTPAVAGAPGAEALRWLAAHEGLARGWYSGPVGWMDAQGNGEFVVALRSALLRGREAHAYAGAGIVAGSDPEAEYAETDCKLRSVLGPLLWGAP
jgi:isochorismate synthase